MNTVTETLNLKRRVRGWMMFDWATQPFFTLGLTFIFGPYFAVVAAEAFLNNGMDKYGCRKCPNDLVVGSSHRWNFCCYNRNFSWCLCR